VQLTDSKRANDGFRLRNRRSTPAMPLVILLALAGAPHVATKAPAPPTVVIDPGHDRFPNPATEPIGPGSLQRKVKDGGGTRGVVSGVPEAVVNLAISCACATSCSAPARGSC
jgi:hypothetical protein